MTSHDILTAAARTWRSLFLVGHCRNQFPVTLVNPSVRKMRTQFVDQIVGFLRCTAQFVLQSAHHFFVQGEQMGQAYAIVVSTPTRQRRLNQARN